MKSIARLLGIAGWIFVFGFLQPAVAAGDVGGRRVEIRLGSLTTLKPSPERPVKEPPNAHAVSVKRHVHVQGAPPKRRSKEMSWQELVVVALDEKGQEIDRAVVPDPRLIRYESADPSGKFIASEILYREEADLTVLFRENPGVRVVKVYHPRWTGKEYVLDLLGEAVLP